MIDWNNPEEVLEYQRNIEWYLVTFTGFNELGEAETRSVQMAGDIEFTVKAWADDHDWDCVLVLDQQYIGQMPSKEQFN